MRPRISAVLITLNEERNIANALRSVASWVDEIVLVDMHSDDRTVEIAESFGATVFDHPRIGFVEPAKAFAILQASGDWIINLDADEVLPYELSRVLVQIACENQADICSIPYLNYIGGHPLYYSGWGPDQDRHDRFFRKGSVVFSPRVHMPAARVPGARVVDVAPEPELCILHFNYVNAAHFLSKLNRYTDIEAQQVVERGGKPSATALLFRPIAMFVKRYLCQHGFRDGWSGFYYCFLMLVYKLTAAYKVLELSRSGSLNSVKESYQEIADRVLSRYDAKQVVHISTSNVSH